MPPRPLDATIAADARPVDAAGDAAADAMPDAALAALPPVDVDHIFDWETIGGFKLGMDERKVLGVLGQPKSKGFPTEEGATGDFVSDWEWKGITVGMAAGRRSGPFHVRSISVDTPSTFATSRGIHVGSTLAELSKIYPRNTEEGNADPNQYLVGSVYGGELFTLEKDKVASIFLGAMAF